MHYKALVLSDIHLGHNINKTNTIVNNLREFFRIYKQQLKNIDMIFLAGDTFDRLLVNSSVDFIIATEWLTELFIYCKQNKIILRTLEGTPSHDWKQLSSFSSIISKLNIEVDYKYVDTLEIEYIKKFDMHVLYVPDEYKHNSKDTYLEVMKLLKKHNIEQVDLAIMHGAFNYQLPIALESNHNEEDYLKIVKHYICIGHIHTHSVKNRILAQGSFDRLVHGEEEPKGGILIDINNDERNYWFLENKLATIFKTYKLEDEDLDKTIRYLDKELNKYPSNSNIRLIAPSDTFITKNAIAIKSRYKLLNIKFDKVKTDKIVKNKLLDQELVITSFNITKDNIVELMDKEMEKYNLKGELQEIYKKELEAIL